MNEIENTVDRNKVIVPFSPLNDVEEAVIETYLKSEKSNILGDAVHRAMRELGAKPNIDLERSALEMAAGLIIGKYASGSPLPNLTIFNDDGSITNSRTIDELALKQRRMFSILLLELNWASSSQGISYPEQYRATWVSRRQRWIVTASQETDDMGYLDVALGHFASQRDLILKKAAPLILRHWRTLRSFNQPPWESIINPGFAGLDLAEGWRKKVWPGDPSTYC